MDTYGYTIKAGDTTYSVSGCSNETWAFLKCFNFAKKGGWTNPRWWEFWRHEDTKLTKAEIEFAEACLRDMENT